MSTATIEQPPTTTETPTVRFRRNAKDEWVLFGPESLVVEGPVTVTKKNGKTSIENVLGVGGSFDVDGVRYRYGYLKPKAEEPKPPAAPSTGAYEGNFVPDDLDAGGDEYVVDEDGRSVPIDF